MSLSAAVRKKKSFNNKMTYPVENLGELEHVPVPGAPLHQAGQKAAWVVCVEGLIGFRCMYTRHMCTTLGMHIIGRDCVGRELNWFRCVGRCHHTRHTDTTHMPGTSLG